MGKESFVIYNSFYKPISRLSDKQLGRLFRAIFEYNISGVVDVEEDISMAFEFFKNQFEIDGSKYQAKIKRDVENGRRGGNPNFKKGKSNPYYAAKKDNPEITEDNRGLCQITEDKAINDNVNDNDVIPTDVGDNIEKTLSKREQKEAEPSPPETDEQRMAKIDRWAVQLAESPLEAQWRDAVTKKHGVRDFVKAMALFRNHILLQSLTQKIFSINEYRKYFDWKAADFITDEVRRSPIPWMARLIRGDDGRLYVEQYGDRTEVPEGTPPPPSRNHVWYKGQWVNS